MTFREHRRISDHAYFESIMRDHTRTEAIKLSGMSRGAFYRCIKRLGISYGDYVWQGVNDESARPLRRSGKWRMNGAA